MIKMSGLEKVYQTPMGAVSGLKNINLSIGRGEIFGVIGKSGAGKSTLIRCINLLERPTSGDIIINGENITRLSGKALRQRRRKMGMIFQHFNLLSSATVYDNVALPLRLSGMNKAEIDLAVMPLLALTGLTEKRDVYPAQLSGGQKQRVAIARALANKPDVLLCDEATSALDSYTTNKILNLLQDINQKLGLTIVLITHEIGIIQQICHAVGVIEQGELVETGRVKDVFLAPKSSATKELLGDSDVSSVTPAVHSIAAKKEKNRSNFIDQGVLSYVS